MLKCYKYRLFPTRRQRTIMQNTLDECRWLYNYFLRQHKDEWEINKKTLTYYSQIKFLPKLKQERDSLKDVHSQVLQNVAMRVDLAYKAFFRRVKVGEKAGYPRFKGSNWYDSFTYPQFPSGCYLKGKTLKLSKIGDIEVVLHRPIVGVIKTCTINRINGKWFVCFVAEVGSNPLPEVDKIIGIDVGLESFVTFSDGSKIDNPRFFRQDEKDLTRIQSKMNKAKDGSRERITRYNTFTKINERIKNRRANFAHQQSAKIVKQYRVICVEDLDINTMVHNHCRAKSISDVAWGQFVNYLSYKAESAGRKLVKVNPAYTSQTCSKCGHRVAKLLNTRIHDCPCCGLLIDRDLNASLNILALGLQSIGMNP